MTENEHGVDEKPPVPEPRSPHPNDKGVDEKLDQILRNTELRKAPFLIRVMAFSGALAFVTGVSVTGQSIIHFFQHPDIGQRSSYLTGLDRRCASELQSRDLAAAPALGIPLMREPTTKQLPKDAEVDEDIHVSRLNFLPSIDISIAPISDADRAVLIRLYADFEAASDDLIAAIDAARSGSSERYAAELGAYWMADGQAAADAESLGLHSCAYRFQPAAAPWPGW